MINYIEKGAGLHEAIRAAGYNAGWVNGIFVSNKDDPNDTTNDAAVQAIINSYDPLPKIKVEAIAVVKATGLAKIQAIFPAIDNFDKLQFYSQFWLSIASAARSPTASFTNMINTYQAGVAAIAQINAATTAAQVAAVVPAWP